MAQEMVIKNFFTQPASMLNTIMLGGMPHRNNKDSVATITFCGTDKPPKNDQPVFGLAAVLDTYGIRDKRMPFYGSSKQVYNLYRDVYFENLASKFVENRMTYVDAKAAMADIPAFKKEGRETPLYATTHKILLPAECAGDDDFDEGSGASFEYYKQNWNEGMERAMSYLTDEQAECAVTTRIVDHLSSCKFGMIYPSFFFAKHDMGNYSGKEKILDAGDAWDIFVAEPGKARHVMTTGSEVAVPIILDFLNNGFMYEAVRADPTLEDAAVFNTMHYETVFGDETSVIEGMTKTYLADLVKRDYGLS